METKHVKLLLLAAFLAVTIWVVYYAYMVFLIAFAALLLGILLNAIGIGAKRITHLPYPLALVLALIFIVGFLALVFWLYSPLIADQFNLLMKQLPVALETLRNQLVPYLGADFLSSGKIKEEFSISNKQLFTGILSVFSTTVGSIVGFFLFLLIGLYFAVTPSRYLWSLLSFVPAKLQEKLHKMMDSIGYSLRWWLLGKMLSMVLVGISTFVGLALLHVNLAFILGFLAGILTFIPYVGAFIASVPAILIGFAQSPLTALYVTILYIGIHMLDGYFITPYIEQRTVAIPPAFTIIAQVLLTLLVGALGLALATPLAVVVIAFAHHSLPTKRQSSLKMVKKAQEANND